MAEKHFFKGLIFIATVILVLFCLNLTGVAAEVIRVDDDGYIFSGENEIPNAFVSIPETSTIRFEPGASLDTAILFQNADYDQWKAWHQNTGADPDRINEFGLRPLAALTLGNGPFTVIMEQGSRIVNRAGGSDGILGFGSLDLTLADDTLVYGEYSGIFLENPVPDAENIDVTIRNRGTIGSYTVDGIGDGDDEEHYSISGIEINQGVNTDILNEGNIRGSFSGIYANHGNNFDGVFRLENTGGSIHGGESGVSVGGGSGVIAIINTNTETETDDGTEINTGSILSDNVGIAIGRINPDYIWLIRKDLIEYFEGEFSLQNTGEIVGNTIGIDVMGESALVTINNDADGSISSGNTAIRLIGAREGTTITNEGEITAVDAGIHIISGTADIIHSGTIARIGQGSFDAIRFGESAVGGNVTLSSSVAGDIRHFGDTSAATVTLRGAGEIGEDEEEPEFSVWSVHLGDGAITQEGGIWSMRDVSAKSLLLENGNMTLNREVVIDADIDVTSGAELFITGGSVRTKNLLNQGALAFSGGSLTIDGGEFDYAAGSSDDLTLEEGTHLRLISGAHAFNIDTLTIGGEESGGTLTLQDSSLIEVNDRLDVAEFGKLSGMGTIRGNVSAQGGSTLEPGDPAGALTIEGDLTIEEGVDLNIRISGGDNNNGVIAVSGDATVGGGTVRVSDVSGGTVRDDAVYTFLTAGGSLAGAFDDLVSLSPLYAFDLTHDYEENRAYFTADRLADYTDAAYARTGNQQAIARALQSARWNGQLQTLTPQMENLLIDILNEDLPASTLSDALDQLSPEPYQAVFRRVSDQASRLNRYTFNGARQSRLKVQSDKATEQKAMLASAFAMAGSDLTSIGRVVEYAVSGAGTRARAYAADNRARISKDELGASAWDSPYRVFYGGYARFGDIDPDSARTGHDYRAREVFLGIERLAADRLIGGLGLGYGNNDVSFDNNRGELRTHSLRVGPYVTWLGGNLEVDLALNMGAHFSRQKREMPLLDRKTVTRFNLYDGTAYTQARYNIPFGENWLFAPLASLRYTYQYREGFTERRAGDARLRLGSDTHDDLRGLVGFSAGRQFRGRTFILVPELFAGWEYDILDTDVDIEARFLNARDESFTVTGEKHDRHATILGVGVTALLGSYNVIFARYETELSDAGDVRVFSAGLKWNF